MRLLIVVSHICKQIKTKNRNRLTLLNIFATGLSIILKIGLGLISHVMYKYYACFKR